MVSNVILQVVLDGGISFTECLEILAKKAACFIGGGQRRIIRQPCLIVP